MTLQMTIYVLTISASTHPDVSNRHKQYIYNIYNKHNQYVSPHTFLSVLLSFALGRVILPTQCHEICLEYPCIFFWQIFLCPNTCPTIWSFWSIFGFERPRCPIFFLLPLSEFVVILCHCQKEIQTVNESSSLFRIKMLYNNFLT